MYSLIFVDEGAQGSIQSNNLNNFRSITKGLIRVGISFSIWQGCTRLQIWEPGMSSINRTMWRAEQ